MYRLDGFTSVEIGAYLGISHARVRQLMGGHAAYEVGRILMAIRNGV